MEKGENIKKPLKEWLTEFYDDTSKLSELVRNLAFAGIALIWIFNKTDAQESVTVNLPQQLISPLKFLVWCLLMDLLQYIWRSINIYIHYKIKEQKYDNGKLSDDDISDVKMPNYILTGTWLFFLAKIILIGCAYFCILSFLSDKTLCH